MNEEKATLKERLVAIMKYTKKSKAITLMSAVLLVVVIGGAVMLGGCAGKTNSEDTNTGIMTPNLTTNTKIENLLALIMSSPLESSNLGDYIAAHQEEYDAIIKMDAEALPYLFSEFEKGGQTGLKSHIMESLCRNILAGEDIKYANTDPQDWYDTYKAHMRSMLEKYSLEFLKEHNPKGSLVLNRVDVEISPEKLLSFIKAYDEKTRMLTIDEVEWVIQGDTKRVKALGLDADLDFPNGYYIYNESDQQTSLKVAEDVQVDLVNWHDLANPSLTNVNGLAERMAEYPDRDPLCHLALKDGVIVGILEQYRP
ncbi:hypothetical protein JT05_07780 [Desulfosporosinus sp. Tol-M]|nr:hypothetical protein JT05_07780 [Desulfosporosinus sp. Tol-M]